jgi:hypothetical protein
MQLHTKLSCAIAAILGGGACSSAIAADTSETTSSGDQIQEIIVTAQRRNENIQNVSSASSSSIHMPRRGTISQSSSGRLGRPPPIGLARGEAHAGRGAAVEPDQNDLVAAAYVPLDQRRDGLRESAASSGQGSCCSS